MFNAKAPQKVLVNGCFDGLHEGHKYVLRTAADYVYQSELVIGLNSDASVRAGKGEGRPINTFEERARAIGEYMGTLDPYVPYTVVEFHGDAIKLARKESPDVIVRGYDQQREIGLPCGIIQLGNYGDYSTTAIADKDGNIHVELPYNE